MCFIVSEKYPKFYTAKKDFFVYKNLREGLKSKFLKFQYNVGIKNPLIKLNPENETIDDGYHSYLFPFSKDSLFSKKPIKVGSYYQFIIPKGTKFFIDIDWQNINFEIVSETIILYDDFEIGEYNYAYRMFKNNSKFLKNYDGDIEKLKNELKKLIPIKLNEIPYYDWLIALSDDILNFTSIHKLFLD